MTTSSRSANADNNADYEIVVFDVGNVLIHWDPRHLYRKLLATEQAVDRFLTEICPPEWNVEQDRGRRWADAIAERVANHPDQADLIRAFDVRWMEMVPGEIEENVALLRRLKERGVRVYGLTNFSAEKWEETCARFGFFALFDGVVVSAHERTIKPEPRIYEILFRRYAIDPLKAVFIDDSPANVAASEALGMRAVRFQPGVDAAATLRTLGLPA